MIKVTITYDTVSEESVAHGDFADHGFADDNGNLYSIADEDACGIVLGILSR